MAESLGFHPLQSDDTLLDRLMQESGGEGYDFVFDCAGHQSVADILPDVVKIRGKIINFASLLSYQGGLRVPAYAASKGAVMQFTKSLANEWSKDNVNVNCIVPGYYATEMNTALLNDPVRNEQITVRIPAGRWGQPEDLVGAAIFLASHASDYVDGIALPVDGGWLGR